ncbi:Hypothetical predicted protein [Mytilus galloprovincialis]|uniref:Uncharacterized protein n=1 Tax=Mytilus galloprovincialis TaxID=29158 RepID=A0A8B6DI81_MYTGA|nr:Hypothetical predicted protein [Mytilus galloprovincialis]
MTTRYQIYKLNKDLRRIKKICPISHTDAWILADRQLYKMVNHALEDTVYVDDADDIVVLKEGYVLVLRTKSNIIMKLLENRRLVRFANVGCSNMLPYCFCNSTEDTLSVYLISDTKYQQGYRNWVVQLNEDGIVSKTFNFYTYYMKKPCLMQNVDSDLCVLYPRYSYIGNLHFINLLNNKCEKIQSFKGILGYDPSDHFECYGLCTNNKDIFVSDLRHHSIYILGKKDLEYKRCVVDARNGLDTPTAVAILNDILWIADGDQMFKFNFNNK